MRRRRVCLLLLSWIFTAGSFPARDVKMSGSSMPLYVPMAQRHKGFRKPTIAVGYITPKRCLVILAAALVVGTVVLRCLLSFRHAFSDMHLRTDIDGELVVIHSDVASKHGAVCLDGESLPGYYIKRGIDDGERKWLMVIPHSDWCNSLTDCYLRSSVPLEGTMEGAPVTHQFSGILSSDPAENKYFADWNMIRLIPCDGSTLLGNVSGVLEERGRQLKMRGAAILAATMEHLRASTTIASAKELVLYGEKSGAVSALIYSGYIRRSLQYIPKFTTLLHSGVIMDIEGAHYNIQALFDLHNIKGNRLLSECDTLACLQADKILSARRVYSVILFSPATPSWPLHILYGCKKRGECEDKESKSKYMQSILKLHSIKEPIKHLVTIISNCDWPIRTTVTSHDPKIDGASIYAILVKQMDSVSSSALYIDKTECYSVNNGTS